jgi:hypothetical protein
MLKYLIKTTKTPDDDTGNGLDDDTANDDDNDIVVPVVRILKPWYPCGYLKETKFQTLLCQKNNKVAKVRNTVTKTTQPPRKRWSLTQQLKCSIMLPNKMLNRSIQGMMTPQQRPISDKK